MICCRWDDCIRMLASWMASYNMVSSGFTGLAATILRKEAGLVCYRGRNTDELMLSSKCQDFGRDLKSNSCLDAPSISMLQSLCVLDHAYIRIPPTFKNGHPKPSSLAAGLSNSKPPPNAPLIHPFKNAPSIFLLSATFSSETTKISPSWLNHISPSSAYQNRASILFLIKRPSSVTFLA